jgi:hypothetical protein
MLLYFSGGNWQLAIVVPMPSAPLQRMSPKTLKGNYQLPIAIEKSKRRPDSFLLFEPMENGKWKILFCFSGGNWQLAIKKWQLLFERLPHPANACPKKENGGSSLATGKPRVFAAGLIGGNDFKGMKSSD